MAKNNLTPDKVKVYETIFRMFAQLVLIATAVIAFFIILNHLLNSEDVPSKIVLGILDAILAATVFKLYSYYFPTKTKKSTGK